MQKATLDLSLSKMRYLKLIVESHLEALRQESDGSEQSKTMIAYKQSILDGIETAVYHAEIEQDLKTWDCLACGGTHPIEDRECPELSEDE